MTRNVLVGATKRGASKEQMREIVSRMTADAFPPDGHRAECISAFDGVAIAGNVKAIGDYLVGYSGRIDRLGGVTGLPKGNGSAVADYHNLILTGFLEKGLQFFKEVFGDFCIVLFDRRKETMTLARDILGVVPAFYVCTSKIRLFAPTMGAILRSGQVHVVPDRRKVAFFLLGTELPADISCFEGVSRLPAANAVKLSATGRRDVVRYHHFQPDSSLLAGSEDANVERFRELLYQSVESRIPGNGLVAAELSGGLDSSSIFSVARDIVGDRVVPFSGVFPDSPSCDESNFIDSVCERWGVSARKFSVDSLNLLESSRLGMEQFNGLHNAANIHISTEIFKQARVSGFGAVLNGVDGDNVVSHGRNYLSELGAKGDWVKFTDEVEKAAPAFSRYSRKPEEYLARGYGIPALNHLRAEKRYLSFMRGFRHVMAVPGVSRRRLLNDVVIGPLSAFLRGRSGGASNCCWRGRFPKEAFNPNFLRSLSVSDLLAHVPDPDAKAAVFEADAHIASFENGVNQHYFEYIWAISRANGVLTISPFMDRPLLEFCISLPAQEKLGHGFTRLILRRAMKGLLPEAVRGRTWKADLSASSLRKVESDVLPLFQRRISTNSSLLAEYMDMDYVSDLVQHAEAHGCRNKLLAGRVWVLFCLSEWLNTIGN